MVARHTIWILRTSPDGMRTCAYCAFLGHQLRRRAGRTHELAAFTGPQLDVVDDGTERDVLQRQRVADLDVGLGTRDSIDRADFEADRREDVALLAVAVVEQRDTGGAVRIVLDRRDLRRNGVLRALEVDDAVLLARAAALMARRDVAVVVAAGMLLLDLEQRLLGIFLR